MNPGPLAGRRFLLTRRREQSSLLRERLESLGGVVVEVPALEIAPPLETAPLDAALARLEGYAWVAFTSSNAVRALRDRWEARAPGTAFPRTVRVASVGPATTAASRECFPGVPVVVEPQSNFRADGLVEALRARVREGERVLLPVSDRARDVVAAGLRAQGAHVDAVVAYRTIVPQGLAERLDEALSAPFDIAVFASPSAVDGFASAAGERARDLPVAVIGPVTEAAARAAGFDVRLVASPSTAEGLVRGLLASLGS